MVDSALAGRLRGFCTAIWSRNLMVTPRGLLYRLSARGSARRNTTGLLPSIRT